MAAEGTETRVLRKVEGAEVGDSVYSIALAVGDSAAAATVRWTLDAVIVPVETREELAVA
jgi:hypothetical protein